MTNATAVAFEKWEGLGNDFVVVVPTAASEVSLELVRALCDRRRGVGADGVLVVEMSGGTHPRMIVFNADGSRPEMCGNGLRCVAAFLESRSAESKQSNARAKIVATDAGDKRCVVQGGTGADPFDVEVEMGAAAIGPRMHVSIDGRERSFQTVDVGNPHAITFEPYTEDEIDRVGPLVATTPRGGINVEFCTVEEGPRGVRIKVVVWERGVGRTLACGTGACAVAAAACATGRASYGSPIIVSLPGGDLEITVGAEGRELRMRGPARKVFTGELVRS